ncbi:MAG TPA: HAD-IIIA family hydrolase [Anaerovoracaceae bacterium]|nr:HAD-IIIA family hydrolase [Anaerovoracaceae bacterium]
MSEVVLLMGFPASGKSTVAKEYTDKGYSYINRDMLGGKVATKVPMMMNELSVNRNVLLDNTFPDAESRAPFIAGAKKVGAAIKCVMMGTKIEDAQFNAAYRMIQRKGKLLGPDDYKGEKDPNIFPPVVLFGYQKKFQQPTALEGFDSVETIPFVRKLDPEFKEKAAIFDYDDTLRKTKSGSLYPTNPDDIEILPGRKEKLAQLVAEGYKLLGVSNQSGVAKGELTDEMARKCFDRTNELLGQSIDYLFCPHGKFPINCYCRKPMNGNFVVHMVKHKLDPAKCFFVGDMTSDKTFAGRAGIKFYHADKYFV